MSEELLNLKVIVVGDGTVGKSSLTQRYVKGNFTSEYKKTLGVDFLTKRTEINNTEVEYLIWDTAGQEYYDAITKRYYKGAHAALIVFSVENLESFNNVLKWKEKVQAECGKIPLILVMNKVDLPEEQKLVSHQEAEDLAMKLNLVFFPTSVKDNKNIKAIFDHLGIQLIQTLKKNLVEIDEEKIKKEEEDKHKEGLSFKNIVSNNGFKLNEKPKENKEKKKKKCCK